MSNIIPLQGSIIPGQPNPDIVEELESLLAAARSGDLLAFAFCTVYADEKGSGWAGNGGTRDSIHAAIAMLHHRFTSAQMEGS